jgi:hypothetical protein
MLNRKNLSAVTSDQWHVVRARLSEEPSAKPRFVRSVVSEHIDRVSAVTAAKQIVLTFKVEMAGRPAAACDQVFVRRPEFKSLKLAKRVLKHRK